MAIHPSTNGGQTYPCTRPGCTRVFKVAAKLRMHDDVVHKNLEGKYKCQFCPKKANSQHNKSKISMFLGQFYLNYINFTKNIRNCVKLYTKESPTLKFLTPNCTPIREILQFVNFIIRSGNESKLLPDNFVLILRRFY